MSRQNKESQRKNEGKQRPEKEEGSGGQGVIRRFLTDHVWKRLFERLYHATMEGGEKKMPEKGEMNKKGRLGGRGNEAEGGTGDRQIRLPEVLTEVLDPPEGLRSKLKRGGWNKESRPNLTRTSWEKVLE